MMPFIHKDREWEWENEFRIIIQRFPVSHRATGEPFYDCGRENRDAGLLFSLDLAEFIDAVVISPTASLETATPVRNLARKHNLIGKVRDSNVRGAYGAELTIDTS